MSNAKYELTKTFQYRKVVKPLLERKRRARINKCLDELKELLAESMQQQQCGEPDVKFEKADILEVTVEHLRQLKARKGRSTSSASCDATTTQAGFRAGYVHAANEVSRCLAALPSVDVQLGTQLMTHLGLRLNQLESAQEQRTAVSNPLSINCSTAHAAPQHTRAARTVLYSPVSSGYGSDSDNSRSSPSAPASALSQQGLLQMATPVWRPW